MNCEEALSLQKPGHNGLSYRSHKMKAEFAAIGYLSLSDAHRS
jgi:hypothetical protein